MRALRRHVIGVSWLAGLLLLCGLTGGCQMPGRTTTAGPGGEDEDIWAIRCLTLMGANHAPVARKHEEALKQVEGLRPDLVQVFHEAGASVLYYGRYRRSYDEKTKTESFRPDHLKDLELIRRLSLTVQDPVAGPRIEWPFQLATMDTLPVSAGGHPEWLLSSAPGYYSLQVAVFYNTGGMRRRKFAAEEYCKLLREQGEEAYYDHGSVNSSVCIGAFPEGAIQTFQEQDPLTGIIRVSSRIVDERMIALQKRFPFNLHNGSKFYEIIRDPRTGKKVRDPHTSFPVEIPREDGQTGFFGE